MVTLLCVKGKGKALFSYGYCQPHPGEQQLRSLAAKEDTDTIDIFVLKSIERC
jgi:hypothetical protein